MKKYFCIILLLIGYNAPAQKIHFSDTSNRWVYSFEGFNVCSGTRFRFFRGDTIVGGKTYQKLIDSVETPYWELGTGCIFERGLYPVCWIREDTSAGIVYSMLEYDTTEYILFNYNLRLGDTVVGRSPSGHNDTVTKLDSVLIGSTFHKIFQVTNPAGDLHLVNNTYMEGIGPLECWGIPTYGNYFEYDEKLLCFAHEGFYPPLSIERVCTYCSRFPPDSFRNSIGCTVLDVEKVQSHKDIVSVHPNPAFDEVIIAATEPITKIVVSDAIGRIISHVIPGTNNYTLTLNGLSPGLYLVEVRYGHVNVKRHIEKLIKQ